MLVPSRRPSEPHRLPRFDGFGYQQPVSEPQVRLVPALQQPRQYLARSEAVEPSRRRPRAGGHEPVEDRQGIERARRALRVVLDRLDREIAVAESLNGAVVEIDLADPEATGGGQRLGDDSHLVILGGDLDEPQVDVADGVIGAVMPEAETPRVGPGRSGHDLVPETDAEQWPAFEDGRAGQRHQIERRAG